MASRLGTVRKRLADLGADAALLTFLPDIRWAVGFTGSNGVLLVTPDAAHFVTDGRYEAQAEREVEGAEIHVPGYKLFEYIAEHALLGEPGTCVVQSDHLTVAQLDRLRGLMQVIRFQPASKLLVEAVATKSDDEIERIRAAQKITDSVFTDLLSMVKPGVAELDLSAEIVYQHLKRGCEWMAFEPIVASGARGALPHAHPSANAIEPGDMVVIDMGGVKDGYSSDMTRTVAVGEPGDEARKVYQVVLDAQEAAIESARSGMTGRDLDQVARKVIDAAGYGDAFSHSLGHGIGLQTHEWPALSSRVEDVLPVGAAVTIEPGIYLPGKFGVRIEDIVVLSEDGCVNLTHSPKELLVL
ncbi:MAG: aminopeptidase P family protein [Bacteroidetes bacterium]|nr:aminopeptidase P family protein [Bacteroidota bacterium]